MLLAAKDVVAGYQKRTVLHQASLRLQQGEIVALIGHNGAGKTTLLKTMMGLLPIRQGSISLGNQNIANRRPAMNVKDGITLVPQGTNVCPNLSVCENLKLGAFTIEGGPGLIQERLEEVFSLFPILAERSKQKAGTMSGGQQKIVAVARALMARPKLMLLDEPSLGLSPVMVQKVLETVVEINKRFGTSIILVEQNVKQALRVSSRVYVMKAGQIVMEDRSESMLARGQFWDWV